MAITVLKNCPGEGVMSHNHPPLYGSLILGGIYYYNIDLLSSQLNHNYLYITTAKMHVLTLL